MYTTLIYILKRTGQQGPIISALLSFLLLWNKKTSLYYYFFGFCLNILLNIILKGLFQQPRPMEGRKMFEVALKHGTEYKYMNGVPFDVFGMPSGHAQSVLYSTIFIHYSFKNKYITFIYLLISGITIYQRVEYGMHTKLQVFVGAVVGSIFGYFIYYMSQRKLVGKLDYKKDDNAFLV